MSIECMQKKKLIYRRESQRNKQKYQKTPTFASNINNKQIMIIMNNEKEREETHCIEREILQT